MRHLQGAAFTGPASKGGARASKALRILVLLLASLATPAQAYPWLVKHGLAACSTCHVDPSGAGQLGAFGRQQAEQQVRWRPKGTPYDPTSRLPHFLWFLELPDAVNLSGNLRAGALVQPGATPVGRGLEMATDLTGTVTLAQTVLLHADVGFGRRDVVAPIVVAPACDPAAPGECGPSLVMRTFWAGVRAVDGVLLRGGRLVVPFGLRNAEHNAWVRALTRTDFNVSQQLGAAVAVSGGAVRAEVMGLAGSWQPGTREGGYSALFEYAVRPTATVGVSSLVARSVDDGTARHAHGAFFRWAPVTPLVLLGEADLLAWQGADLRVGYAAFVQADWEVVQGLHLMVTGESAHRGFTQRGASLGAWASLAWYFFSHLELRVDNLLRRTDEASGLSYALVVQLHAFL